MIIIPIGGIGTRFKYNNYMYPKALIKVFGKPIIFWLLDSLGIKDNTLIYIPYNNEYLKYRFEGLLKKHYPKLNFKFFVLQSDTRGAAETVNIALKELNIDDEPIISLDCDNFYITDVLNQWNNNNCVLTFKSNIEEPIYSYIITNENNEINKIAEKEKISDEACCGGYAFASYKELLRYTQIIIDNNITVKNEFYMSNVINEMINNNIKFISLEIKTDHYICLGTPLQLKYFCNNYPKKSCINLKKKISNLRICFNLDNTLVSFPTTPNDYTTVKPIIKNIKYAKYLKSFGNTIIIYTSRGMKTDSNIGKSLVDIGKITFNTLEEFEIPCDEIYFGKPQADMYIDDKAINCFDNLEKNIGFYLDAVKPRDFNQLDIYSIEIFKKQSEDLSGEIYYYKNIPNTIKDMFPILIDYDIHNKWYKIEKIYGLTASSHYTSELLNNNIYYNILNSIKRIQLCNIDGYQPVDIYGNYSLKLDKRYNSYDYSMFPRHKQIYNEINDYLKKYENNNEGRISVIHGDPVFTNLLINQFEKIKFIDMRGTINNNLTILGDWLYDWAKIYQSLIGYDNILLEKEINKEYQKKMIKFFTDYFLDSYTKKDLNNLKMITKSLIFTLIPLHNNDNCKLYYRLICSEYLILDK